MLRAALRVATLALACVVVLDAAALTSMPVVDCFNGQVDLEIKQHTLNVDGQVTFTTRLYFYNGAAQFPAPTIRMKAGTQCKVNITNSLNSGSTQSSCPSHSNSYHCADTTNLHTHGLHVSPYQDNIDTSIVSGQSLTYTYDMPESHLMGTHWYHAHHHGSTALQVLGGMAGVLLVEPASSYTLPTSLSNVYNNGRAKTIILNHVWLGANDGGGGVFSMDSYTGVSSGFGAEQSIAANPSGNFNAYVVNGQYQPTATMFTDDATVFRIVNGGGVRVIDLTFTPAAGTCSVTLLARDGVFHTGSYLTVTSVAMLPGTRADIALFCDTATTVTVAAVNVPADNACLGGNQHTQSIVMTITVQDKGGNTVYPIPTEFATMPYYLNSLLSTTAANPVTFSGAAVTSINLGGGDEGPPRHGVNGVSFKGFHAAESSRYTGIMLINKTYTWTLGNGGGGNGPVHPYHVHINHFQIQTSDSCGQRVWRQGEWRDVAPQKGIAVKYPTYDFYGDVVMHCHLLEHEDFGMMGLWRICNTSETTGACAAVNSGTNNPTNPSPAASTQPAQALLLALTLVALITL